MAAKFYAVKKGSLTGIFRTWDECRACVEGYPGPIYKSFTTLEEAAQFLGWINETKEKKAKAALESDVVPIYVDGSFHSATGEFSYGMVVIKDGEEITFKEKFDDSELATMHNVAGEIKGAQAAMQYAIDKGIGKIAIFHDYEGIAKWCTGEWKANKDGTKAYKAFYEDARSKIEVQFVKVAGHTGDKYNEMADKLAKEALGIL